MSDDVTPPNPEASAQAAAKALFARPKAKGEPKLPRRWLFFELDPRDLEEPEARFVGKVIAEYEPEHETVLMDQGRRLYWLRYAKFDRDGDFVSVRTEMV